MIRLALLAITLTSLAACATVEGAGKDISKAGVVISNTAKSTQKNM